MPARISLPLNASKATKVSLVSLALCAATVMGSAAFAQQPSTAKAPAAAAATSGVPDEAQPGLSKGEIKAIREFKMLDFNGDGKLSRSEVKLFPRLAAAFDDADTDRDGFVSYEEVRAFSAKYRAERDRNKAAQAAASAPASGASSATP